MSPSGSAMTRTLVVELHHEPARGLVARPLRQRTGVGIAVAGERHPGILDRVREVLGRSLLGRHAAEVAATGEQERDLDRMAGAEPAVQRGGRPGEPGHPHQRAADEPRLGEPEVGHVEGGVGEVREPDVLRRRVGLGAAVRGERAGAVGERVAETIGELVVGRRQRAQPATVRGEQAHLVAGVGDQQRHVGAVADGDRVDDVVGEHDAVLHRCVREAGLRLDEALDGDGLELFDVRDSELVHERGGLLERLVDLAQVEAGAALRDGAVEEPARAGHGEQASDAVATRRLAEDRDVGRVATERGDVVADPTECGDLVEQGDVARAGEPRVEMVEVREAERAEPVVHGDHDDVAATRQLGGVEERARPDVERAAVDPDHDRSVRGTRFRARTDRGREHVEREAVLAERDVEHAAERCGLVRLRCAWAPSRGVTHPGPRLHRLRRQEPALAERWRRERNAAELRDPVGCEPLQLAVVERDPHVRGRFGGRTT